MEWLKKLKKGDLVIVSGNYGDSISKITHTTKTQVHTKSIKFRRSDGRMVGAGVWDHTYLKEATEEGCSKIRELVSKKKLIDEINKFALGGTPLRLDNAQLSKIVTVIRENTPKDGV